ncbi:MAG TPA: glycosyl hydrolase [Cyclobacteriaceae bacterium]|nr:glycosyl hydrolase [Cyclobacteriaceae bacterium]
MAPAVLWAQLIDKKATQEAQALYSNLKRISTQGFLFGHQDTDAYGVGWRHQEARSDVKEVCGSYPAVHGWDVGKSLANPMNIDSVSFDKMLGWIKQTYLRGGVNTVSWHVDNPVTKKDAWDKTPAVKDILPGGKAHAELLRQLDLLAGFLGKCKSGSTYIPIIFRPWHEHNGDWFWWGKGNCTENEYVRLWRFTIEYLRDKKQLHHLIYAWSPDRSRTDLSNFRTSYLYAYPGDGYVDVLGLDNYMDVGARWNKRTLEEQQRDFAESLKGVSTIASEKAKLAAMTETGMEGISNAEWFSKAVLKPIKENDIKIAYLLVWRNANKTHHYAPYKGHSSEKDFIIFYNDKRTLFEDDVQNLYQSNKPLTRK